jgi:hypothetical protein
MISARQAWWRWQQAAGPWQGWSICPALLSPAPLDAATPASGAKQLASALAHELRDQPTLVALHLDPVTGVQIAARLANIAHPVLLIPRWPYPRAVLPTHHLVHALIENARRLPRDDTRRAHVVFILDTQHGRWHRTVVDNRYRLSPGDLPDLRTLRERGIQRVLKIAQ